MRLGNRKSLGGKARNNKKTRQKPGLHDALRSAGLAVKSHLAAARAKLLEFKTIRSVATILSGDIVAFLAHGARHRDTRTDVGALCHSYTSTGRFTAGISGIL